MSEQRILIAFDLRCKRQLPNSLQGSEKTRPMAEQITKDGQAGLDQRCFF
jgi:hypothetical protein